jgi:hypothetical protein
MNEIEELARRARSAALTAVALVALYGFTILAIALMYGAGL